MSEIEESVKERFDLASEYIHRNKFKKAITQLITVEKNRVI